MKKYLLSLTMLFAFTICMTPILSAGNFVSKTVKEKAAKEVSRWDQTLTYEAGATETQYEASVNDDKGMLLTDARYTPIADGNTLKSIAYKFYKSDKLNKQTEEYEAQEQLSGEFNLEEKYTVIDAEKNKTEILVVDASNGDDAYVQAISRNMLILRVYAGPWGAYTKDNIFVYRIKKGTPKLMGGPIAIPRTGGGNNYTIKIYFAKSKIIVSVINKNDAGTQTENYVKIYNTKLTQYTKITGTTNSNILADTQKYQTPKFWASEDITYNGDFSKTYKKIKIYK